MTQRLKHVVLATGVAALAFVGVQASSHREAPRITKTPKVDGTDFYMFRSYEAGRSAFVTIIANYLPLQDVYGGPNFFLLDEEALYEIHVDNNGDALEDLTFQFRFQNLAKDLSLDIGGVSVAVPLVNVGRIGPGADDTDALNVTERYTVTLVHGDRRTGSASPMVNARTGDLWFKKPVDRIGDKSIRDDHNPLASVPPNAMYDLYADRHIHDIQIPGCDTSGRVFVGQRREGFVVNLAETFDLINTNPIGPRNGETNDLADKNITTLALELPIACLTRPGQPILGAWTTASLLRNDNRVFWGDTGFRKGATPPGQYRQVSRLGNPLVNEVVIGLKDKDLFNSSEPKNDGQFAHYVTNPTLPALIQALFSVPAPSLPRQDLVQVFLTGVPGLTEPPGVVGSEMLRLNTAVAVRAPAAQDSLGVLAGDLAGFPNGRRPGDDVVDIALRAVEGVLLPSAQAPGGQLPYTDGALISATIAYTPDGTITGDESLRLFRDTFPYLRGPLSGSPNPTH